MPPARVPHRRALTGAVLAVLVATAVGAPHPAVAGQGLGVVRPTPHGDRFETAAAIARLAFPHGVGEYGDRRTAILVNGDDPVDALAASAAAGTRFPILYTHRDRVPDVTLRVLEDLDVQQVLMAGSEATISTAVGVAVRAEDRFAYHLGGADRYETAELWARMVPPREAEGQAWPLRALVVAGDRMADALAAAPWAAARGVPLILTERDRLSPAAERTLRRVVDPDPFRASRVVVVGGAPSVSDAVLAAVDELPGDPRVQRIAGADRYETAAEVARWAPQGPTSPTAGLANGEKLVDALPGSVLLAQRGAPVLLTGPSSLGGATSAALQERQADLTTLVVLGGPASVPEAVVDQARTRALAPALTATTLASSPTSITVRTAQRADFRLSVAVSPSRPLPGAAGFAPPPAAPPAGARVGPFVADTSSTTLPDGQPAAVGELATVRGLQPGTRYDVWVGRSVEGLPVQWWAAPQATQDPGPRLASVTADAAGVHVQLAEPVTSGAVTFAVRPAWTTVAEPGYSAPDATVGGGIGPGAGTLWRRTVRADAAPVTGFTVADVAPGAGYEVFVRTERDPATAQWGGSSAWSWWNSARGASQDTWEPGVTAPSVVTPAR